MASTIPIVEEIRNWDASIPLVEPPWGCLDLPVAPPSTAAACLRWPHGRGSRRRACLLEFWSPARLPPAVGSRKREREGEIESDRGGCALAIGTFGPRQRVGYGARRAWSRPRCEHVMAHGCVRDSITLFIQLFSFKKYCLLCYNNIEMAM